MDYLAENYNYHSGDDVTKENIAYYIKHRDTDGKVQEYIDWALSYNENDSFYTDAARLRLKKQVEQLMTPRAGNAMQPGGHQNPTVYNVNGSTKSLKLFAVEKPVTWYEPPSTEMDFNIGVGIEDNRYELLWQMSHSFPPTLFEAQEEDMTFKNGTKEEYLSTFSSYRDVDSIKDDLDRHNSLEQVGNKGRDVLKHYSDTGGLKEREEAEYERMITEQRKTDPYFGMSDDERAQEKQRRLAVDREKEAIATNWVTEQNEQILADEDRLALNQQQDDDDIYHPKGGGDDSLATNTQADMNDVYADPGVALG